MSSKPSSSREPFRLVADLDDPGARERLLAVAAVKGIVRVPLLTLPLDDREAALEVRTPGRSEPLLLRAQLMGVPSAAGCPLRLSLPGGDAPPPVVKVPSAPPPPLAGQAPALAAQAPPAVPELAPGPARAAVAVATVPLFSMPPAPPAPVPSFAVPDLPAASAPPRRASARPAPPPKNLEPEWLQRGSSVPEPGTDADYDERAMTLSLNTASFLAHLASIPDAQDFRHAAAPLRPVALKLADRGDVAPIWRLATTLDELAGEPPLGPGTRAAIAAAALASLFEQDLLRPIAARALAGAPEAARLVVRAGLPGAYAAYAARLTKHDAGARASFVAMLRDIGDAALPAFGDALDHIEPRRARPGAAAIVEDLQAALPAGADAQVRERVARMRG